MARKQTKKSARTSKKVSVSPFNIYWEKKNYFFLFLGFGLLVLGYFLMSLGSWDSFTGLVISPIILIIAYLLIFPASILYRKKEAAETKESEVDPGQSKG